MKNKFKKGVSLYFVVITILLIFSAVLVLGNIIYVRIKMIKDKGDSVAAFFAANAGVEKLLYYKYDSNKELSPITYPSTPGWCYEMSNQNEVSNEDTNYCFKALHVEPADPQDLYKIISHGKYNKVNRGIMVRW